MVNNEASLAVDRPLFDQLYHTYCQAIYGNIHKLVHSQEDAEDILQEVFTALWENWEKVQNHHSIANWLFVVSYNKSLSFLKKKVNSSVEYIDNYLDYNEYPDNSNVDEDTISQQLASIDQAIHSLSGQKKEVFKLARFEGKSRAEIAQIMNISQETVKDYLKQSNKTIKKFMQQNKMQNETFGLLIFLSKVLH